MIGSWCDQADRKEFLALASAMGLRESPLYFPGFENAQKGCPVWTEHPSRLAIARMNDGRCPHPIRHTDHSPAGDRLDDLDQTYDSVRMPTAAKYCWATDQHRPTPDQNIECFHLYAPSDAAIAL